MHGEFSFVGNFSLLGLCLNLGDNERKAFKLMLVFGGGTGVYVKSKTLCE